MKLFSTEADAPLLLDKGAEMGRFKLGSTVILLLPEGVINWRDHLAAGAPVKMGEVIAHQTES
jgi:phosphatidylserine decarboxylase